MLTKLDLILSYFYYLWLRPIPVSRTECDNVSGLHAAMQHIFTVVHNSTELELI